MKTYHWFEEKRIWLATERHIGDLEIAARGWAVPWALKPDDPCFAYFLRLTTATAYIERTETGCRRLWLRGYWERLKR